jgi:hypothetical protein
MTHFVNSDGVFKDEYTYQAHEDKLYRKRTQPTENLILNRNAEMRKNSGILHDLGAQSSEGSWGRQVASIPMSIYWQAIKDGYELNASDSKHAEKEMWRFLQTDTGKLCMIQGD